jgi:hypothetical protein
MDEQKQHDRRPGGLERPGVARHPAHKPKPGPAVPAQEGERDRGEGPSPLEPELQPIVVSVVDELVL